MLTDLLCMLKVTRNRSANLLLFARALRGWPGPRGRETYCHGQGGGRR